MFSFELSAAIGGIVLTVFTFGYLKSEHDSLKEKVTDLSRLHAALDSKIMEKLTTIAVDLAEIKGKLSVQKEG